MTEPSPVETAERLRGEQRDYLAQTGRLRLDAILIGSLFSGSGMLDEAVRSVVGGNIAWHADVDEGAQRVLRHHYPDVPNLGDVTVIDWATVPRVDILTGGFPCQDVSHAGKRAGMGAATRSGLWARMCDAIDALRPSLVIAENVRGLTSACAESDMGICARCLGGTGPHDPLLRGLGRVLGDLAELGYDAQWFGLPASDVGAPHERFRIFIVARDAAGGRWDAAQPAGECRESAWPPRGSDRATLADAADGGHAARGARGHAEGQPEPTRDPRTPADAERGGRDGWSREPLGGPVGRTAAARTGQDAATNTDDRAEHGQRPRAESRQRTGASADTHRDALRQQPVVEPRRGSAALARLDREAAPDTDRDGLAPVGRQQPSQRDTHRRDSEDIAWGDYEPAIRRWEQLTRPAPAPTERGTRGGQRLSRWFDEWMMGWPDGWVTDVPGVTYKQAIRLCGNGVVPQQAATAVRVLLNASEAAA